MTVILFSILLLVVGLFVWLDYDWRVRKRLLPGPKGTFLVGNVLDIFVTPDKLFHLGRKYAKQFKEVYCCPVFNILTINIYNPKDIEALISSTKNNEKSFVYNFIRPWLGDGLLLSKGQKWHDRRKILTPTFHFNILRSFCASIDESTRNMVDGLKDKVGVPIDVVPVVSEYTLTTNCETSMGTRLKSDCIRWKEYKNSIYLLGDIILERFSKFYMYPDFLHRFTNNFCRQRSYLKTVHDFTKQVIKDRKEYLKSNGQESAVTNIRRNKRTAMLDLLIAAENEGIIDEEGIQEEVDTFMFEGHDTTASALAFCLVLLANNSHIQERIVEELQKQFGDSNKQLTIEDFSEMRYLERCIKESLRLYPPVHFINRVITEEIMISGQIATVGSVCNVHIYDLHRCENLFPDPEKFDPDRFLPENCINRHPYAFLPFSAGPRNCIGQKFAMMSMKSALSGILRRYKLLSATTPKDITLLPTLVLRSAGPLNVIFVERTE